MCQKESWGAIFATTEAHSTQRDRPPRMHGPGLWMYEQKEQRVTPVWMIGVNCILWCRGGMAKISEVGRSKTQDTPPDHGTNTEHDPLLEGQSELGGNLNSLHREMLFYKKAPNKILFLSDAYLSESPACMIVDWHRLTGIITIADISQSIYI